MKKEGNMIDYMKLLGKSFELDNMNNIEQLDYYHNLSKEEKEKRIIRAIEDFKWDQQFRQINNLGFEYAATKADLDKSPRVLFYNSELKIFLALESDGMMRYVSPLLPERFIGEAPEYKRNSYSKIHVETDILKLADTIYHMAQSDREEITEIGVEDLPLLSLNEENKIREEIMVSTITNFDQDNFQLQEDDDCIIQQDAINKKKQEVYETLPDTLKEIVTKPVVKRK